MTLRARIAAAAGLAVALAVLAAAIALYVGVRSELRGEIDRSLLTRASELAHAPLPPGGRPSSQGNSGEGEPGQGEPGQGTLGQGELGQGEPGQGSRPQPGFGGFPDQVQPMPLGGASPYVQFVSPDGKLHVPGGQGTPSTIPFTARDRSLARVGRGRFFSDRTVKGTPLRVLSLGTGARGAVLVARPLSEVNHELRRVLLILAIVGLAGIAIAAALGALVARAALAPIARFTRRTETIAESLERSQRLPSDGRDELARLAHSFNTTLDALERSVQAQRNLIADAGHELRTPIASLRANIQILSEAQRLPPEDQQSLREDIVSELDELTRLVGDVVELARGNEPSSVPSEMALDEVVEEAVERARRRADVRIETHLEPATIEGQRDRVERAVWNLLENACKWSPTGGLIEVDLRAGVLSVRDHGPGFAVEDLPHVFERFYRAASARTLPGSGLGLAIVRQAAEAHHGQAQAENAPGGGALVRVSFGAPRSSEASGS